MKFARKPFSPMWGIASKSPLLHRFCAEIAIMWRAVTWACDNRTGHKDHCNDFQVTELELHVFVMIYRDDIIIDTVSTFNNRFLATTGNPCMSLWPPKLRFGFTVNHTMAGCASCVSDVTISLKRKGCHLDEIVVNGYWKLLFWSQWRKFRQNDHLPVSVPWSGFAPEARDPNCSNDLSPMMWRDNHPAAGCFARGASAINY